MTTSNASGLFDVDIKGFKQTLVGEAARILTEPISNALDTGATKITVDFVWENGNAYYTVEDNDPEGFESLRDAYTLFAPSTRKNDTSKRGRFGFGEKEFIALCWPGTVTIASTKGAVVFEGDERKTTRNRRTEGSIVQAKFRLTKDEAIEFVNRVKSLLIPEGVEFVLYPKISTGGHFTPEPAVLKPRPVVKAFKASLPTIHADDEGNLRPTRRSTEVTLHDPLPGETPTIYELGVPVVEHDGRWHVNVGQKVPLNRSRDNVTPAYLRQLREYILNETYSLLTSVDAKSAWVTEALPAAQPEAIRKVVEQIHGTNAVIFDPSNPEATKLAAEQGRTIIHGRQFTADVWNAIKSNDIVKPAGQVIETAVKSSPDGKPPIPQDLWTDDQLALACYTIDAGEHLLGFRVNVQFQDIRGGGKAGHSEAWWGGRTITFNLGCLGKRWPETASQERIDALLLHEFAHHFADDHYSAAFYDSVARLGAKLRTFEGRVR